MLMECIPLHKAPTSPQAMIRSVVSLMEPYAEPLRVELKVVLDPGLPETITVDEDKIAWALGMLIGNALRHVEPGSFFHPGGEITVHAGIRQETGDVIIEVSDTGPGIPPDLLPLLFQPAPYQRRIGYAVILGREIMLAQGGTMDVESTQDPINHGTTVRILLPGR